jgi:hypothetical protein
MKTRTMAAVDLGASSGRVMLARFEGRALSLEEAHRFANQPVRLGGQRAWRGPAGMAQRTRPTAFTDMRADDLLPPCLCSYLLTREVSFGAGPMIMAVRSKHKF